MAISSTWHNYCLLVLDIMAEQMECNRVVVLTTDKSTVTMLSENLGPDGFVVEHVKEPSRLLEHVKNNLSDVVVLSVDIKGVKAYDLIPILKKMNRCVPVIVISNDDSIEVASRVREQGVFFYAIKPLDIKETKLVLKNAITRKLKCLRESSWDEKRESSKEDIEQEILDIDRACEILNMNKKTITSLAENGEIPANKIDKNWYFLKNQLFKWFNLTAGGNQRNYGTLIVETMDEGVAVVDRYLKIVSCNSAYLQSLDIPRDRVIGEYCYKVSHRSVVPCAESTCPARQAFKTASPVKFMHINYDEEGNAHYCDVVALPIKDEHGDVREVIEIIRDNTEIYHLNRHLNWVIGFVAHELKGTLGSIMMNISALADEKISKNIDENKRNDMLISSVSSMKLMHDMIRNYLISSKANSGQLPFEAKLIDIHQEVVKSIIDEIKPLLLKKGMAVELRIEGQRPIVCDRELMRIVFSNLINNAVKYGAAKTKILCKINYTNTDFEIDVFNEGAGIPKDKLADVFAEFTRFDTSGVGGTGLGLYVVKAIISMHQGTVRAESGFIVEDKPIHYEKFYSDDEFFELREKEKELRKFARFIVRIPDRKIIDTSIGNPSGISGDASIQQEA